MRIRTILAAAAAPAALAAILLGTAGQASAAVTQPAHVEGMILLTHHDDSDFSGQNWALDNFVQRQVVTNIVHGSDDKYSYTVHYGDVGTFTTQKTQYVGQSSNVDIPQGALGVMYGTGTVTVTGASQVPDQKYLKSLNGSTADESQVLAPGGGAIGTWNYDYHYKIPRTGFSAEQSNTVNTP